MTLLRDFYIKFYLFERDLSGAYLNNFALKRKRLLFVCFMLRKIEIYRSFQCDLLVFPIALEKYTCDGN